MLPSKSNLHLEKQKRFFFNYSLFFPNPSSTTVYMYVDNMNGEKSAFKLGLSLTSKPVNCHKMAKI